MSVSKAESTTLSAVSAYDSPVVAPSVSHFRPLPCISEAGRSPASHRLRARRADWRCNISSTSFDNSGDENDASRDRAPDAKLDIDEILEEQAVTHAKTRFLHVANGTCTTRLIEAAGIPGTLSIWADPLYEGPVPGGLSDAELLEGRVRHLAGPPGIRFIAWGGSDASLDAVNDLRQWRATIARHESYDELILWFEHDLFDQLNLIQLLSWIHERLPAGKIVSLVCIASFPGHPRFKGLGELTPDELASLLETRQRVSEPHYALAELAWEAFRKSTPEALDNIRQRDTSALPYLADAVARFLQEYPWTVDGLSRTERRLLELASGGSIRLSTAFPRMHDGEDFYYITDASLAALAEELSRTSPALLTLALQEGAADDVLLGSVTITDAGRAVLAAQQDRIATCGIDRWFGGVHLQTDATLWRWDETRQRIANHTFR